MGPVQRTDADVADRGDRRVPGAHELIDTALASCHDELQHELESSTTRLDDSANESWRKPVVAFATFASRHDVPPERVVAAFKKMVLELRPLQRLIITERTEVVRRLVDAAIEAYYRK